MTGQSDDDLIAEQELQNWASLRDHVIRYLESFGKRFGPFTDTDFWVVDEYYSIGLVQVEVLALDLFDPPVIFGLQALLIDYPQFGITVAAVPPDGVRWPRMGVSILPDVIVDGLKRAYLPEKYRTLHYEGSRAD